MGPRALRRRVVVVSSDAEAEVEDHVQTNDISDEGPKPQKRAAGKLKSIKSGTATRKNVVESAKDTPQPSPQKAKAKTKTIPKDSPKQSGKPIYSFFKAATHRQQGSQIPSSPEKNAFPSHDVETIQDDLEDGRSQEASSNTTLSQASSTALAVRKRKFTRTQSFEDESSLPSIATQKFLKTRHEEKKATFSTINVDKRPWTEQFAPVDVSELAVHKRKVADVRGWLEATLRGKRQKILVLKGASGTGKTTTVRLLAQELGIELLEWRDPGVVGSDGNVSSAARFEDFVARSGKVAGLTLSTNVNASTKEPLPAVEEEGGQTQRPQAILVEEFPDTFSRTSNALQSFRSTLAQYVSTTVSNEKSSVPMIMVISETLLSSNTAAADSFTAHRLLGPELNTNPYINVIEFNSIAQTFMVKALEGVVVKEARKSGRRRTPGPQVIAQLAECGDIRSAVSSLEFLCVRGDDGDWSSKVVFTKAKQSKGKNQPPLTKAEEAALKLISNRESSLGIFHSVGKVVYNKRRDAPSGLDIAQPPTWLPQHRRIKIPETNADALIDELGTDTSTFVSALHENYALSCGSIATEDTLDSLSGCMDNLSDSDLLSLDRYSFGTRAFSGSATDTLRQDELCFQVATRGILFSLPHPVHRAEPDNGRRGDAYKIFYPASLRLWRRREELEDQLDLVVHKLAMKGAAGSAKCRGSKAGVSKGVEDWGRTKSFKSSDSGSPSQDVDVRSQLSTEAKNEMLMDRLPYLAHILSGPRASTLSRSLCEDIMSITRLDGLSLPADDEEADAEEGEARLNAESWTTDRPDVDSSSPRKRRSPQRARIIFDGAKLPPIESGVEKLVLEEDDIED